MSIPPEKAAGNGLLARLPQDALATLLPRLSPVTLAMRDIIYLQDGPQEAVYFPTSGMISMVVNLHDGMQAEVGLTGREGMAGISLIAGVTDAFTESMVQLPGAALRMTARDFRHECDENTAFRTLLLRYNEAVQAQVMQTAACNGRHALEQRLARWLLMAHDRAEGDELQLTQDLIAFMLCVHRPSITVAAGILQRAGLIRYATGRIAVLDRRGLEAAACECHAAVQRRFAAILGPLPPKGM